MKLKIVGASGNRAVLNRLGSQTIRYKKGVTQGYYKAGESLVRQIKRDLNDTASKTGRLYRIHGRLHRASGPFQTAATITGKYEDSVGVKVNGTDRMDFGAGVEYTKYLELGTSKMLPRPSLSNTIKKEERNTYNYLGNSVMKWLCK